MKNAFVVYIDMDGVLNLFEKNVNARRDMWKPKYFLDIEVREGISNVLKKINKECHVVILTKVINRIGVTKEKMEWLKNNIEDEAYDDIIFVPYDKSKSDYLYSYFPSMLIDDNEKNLAECQDKGVYGVFLSDLKVSQKFPNVKKLDDIYTFYKERSSIM